MKKEQNQQELQLQKEIIEVQELFEREYEKINEQNYIVLSENTILAKSNLGLYAQRILKVVTSLIKADDQPHKQYRFRIEDFCKVFNLNGQKIHNNIKNGFLELKASFVLPIGKGRVTSWISYGQIYDNDIVVEFDPVLLPLYQQTLQGQYKLINVTGFAYSYTFRFYELFCLKLGNKTECEFEIDIENLKRWLQIENKYKMFNDLKKRILLPVIDDINGTCHKKENDNFCNLRVTYEEIKSGKKVTTLKFKVTKLENDDSGIREINIADAFFDSLSPEAQIAYTHFKDNLKVSKSAIIHCVNTHGEEVFTKIYLQFRNRPNNGIKNMAAYAATCLRNGYFTEEPELPKRIKRQDVPVLPKDNYPTEDEAIKEQQKAEELKAQEERKKQLEELNSLPEIEQKQLYKCVLDFAKEKAAIKYMMLKQHDYESIKDKDFILTMYLNLIKTINEEQEK